VTGLWAGRGSRAEVATKLSHSRDEAAIVQRGCHKELVDMS
jgi:hypothetical protein